MCTPVASNEDESYNCTLSISERAVAIFKQRKALGQSRRTNETFTACFQSMEEIISRYHFSYVLPEKFTSDFIEER